MEQQGDKQGVIIETPFWFVPLIPTSSTHIVSDVGNDKEQQKPRRRRDEDSDDDEEEEKEEVSFEVDAKSTALWLKDCKKTVFKITLSHHLEKIVLENIFECEVYLKKKKGSEGGCDFLEVADYCQDVFVSTALDSDEEEDSEVEGLSIPLVATDNGDRISFLFPSNWGTEPGKNCIFLTAGSTGVLMHISEATKRHKVPRGDHDITLQVAVTHDSDDASQLRSVELLFAGCASARERLAFMAQKAAKSEKAAKDESERAAHRRALIALSDQILLKELMADDVLERGKKRSGHATEEELKEYFDPPEVLKEKVAALADLFRKSQYAVAYTGAGVSTSANLPDYRGSNGLWTLRDRGEETSGLKDLKAALPTPTHMALTEMVNRGLLKHVGSTNLDGLHRRSGLARKDLSELHGNCFVEKCTECGAIYEREEDVGGDSLNHMTGNDCEDEDCQGALVDNIINFGEFTERPILDTVRYHGTRADLTLVLGTSMKVTAACYLPLEVLSRRHPEESSDQRVPGKMVIVNLQKTPFDSLAALRIFAKCDEVVEMLAKELDVEVPVYQPPRPKTPPPNISRITYL